MKNKANICEVFSSIQGEGDTVGVPSVFVRFSNCNLACPFCDSKYAKDGKSVAISGLVNKIFDEMSRPPIRNIVFTGGEPFTHKDFFYILAMCFKRKNYSRINFTQTDIFIGGNVGLPLGCVGAYKVIYAGG